MPAQELGSRPRILSGMDEEGGEPIYAQAQGLRMRRLPRYSPSNPFITDPWSFLENRTYKGCGASNTNRIEELVGASNVQDRSKLGTSRGLRNSRRGSTIPRSNRRAAPACPRFAYSTRRLGVIPLHVKISPRCMPFAPDSEVLRLVARGLAIPPHRALLPGARDAPRLPNCSTGKGYMRKATCSAAEAPYVKGRSYA